MQPQRARKNLISTQAVQCNVHFFSFLELFGISNLPEKFSASGIGMNFEVAVTTTAAIRAIMKTYNQRLYRMGSYILRNDGEAEDVMRDR